MADRPPLIREPATGLPEALPAGDNLALGGGKLVGVGSPTAPSDGVPLSYLQTYAGQVTPGYSWKLNDDLSGYTIGAGAPAGDGGDGFYDGHYLIVNQQEIVDFYAVQRAPGSGGTTSVEIWRVRAGAFFLLATLSLVPAGGNWATTTAGPPAGPDNVLQAGDIVALRATSVQTASAPTYPMDLTTVMRTK